MVLLPAWLRVLLLSRKEKQALTAAASSWKLSSDMKHRIARESPRKTARASKSTVPARN